MPVLMHRDATATACRRQQVGRRRHRVSGLGPGCFRTISLRWWQTPSLPHVIQLLQTECHAGVLAACSARTAGAGNQAQRQPGSTLYKTAGLARLRSSQPLISAYVPM